MDTYKLNSLKKLGFTFWQERKVNKSFSEEDVTFYKCKNEVLFCFSTEELKAKNDIDFDKFLISLCLPFSSFRRDRVELKEIESLENFGLVLLFGVSKKTFLNDFRIKDCTLLEFEGIANLLNNPDLKQSLWLDIKEYSSFI